MNKNKLYSSIKTFFVLFFLLIFSLTSSINFAGEFKTSDAFYPTFDLKLGNLPKDKIIQYMLGNDNLNDFDVFIKDQLDNVTWCDNGLFYDRIAFFKMTVTNEESYDMYDVELKIIIHSSSEGESWTYLHDCSWIIPHTEYDEEGNLILSYKLPVIPAESISFLNPDEEKDYVVFALKPPQNLDADSGQIEGKILSTRKHTFTEWDYQVAPHMMDTVNLSSSYEQVIKKTISGEPIGGSEIYKYYTIGDKIEVTMDLDFYINVEADYFFSDLEFIEYIPNFLEIDVENISNDQYTNVTYEKSKNRIKWSREEMKYSIPSVSFSFSYTATITKNSSFNFISTVVDFFNIQDLYWMGIECDMYRPVLFMPEEFYDFGSLSVDKTYSTFFQIYNKGNGTISYVIEEECDWMEIYPNCGTLTKEHDIIHIDVNPKNLTEEEHEGKIEILSNFGKRLFKIFLTVKSGNNKDLSKFEKGFVIFDLFLKLFENKLLTDFIKNRYNIFIENNIKKDVGLIE